MKIGFIGAGVVAQTISKHVLAVGHRVLLSNTRGPESLAPLVKELGSGAEAGTPQQATEQEIVVLAECAEGPVLDPRLERTHTCRHNQSASWLHAAYLR